MQRNVEHNSVSDCCCTVHVQWKPAAYDCTNNHHAMTQRRAIVAAATLCHCSISSLGQPYSDIYMGDADRMLLKEPSPVSSRLNKACMYKTAEL
jgi:hypothetical protein